MVLSPEADTMYLSSKSTTFTAALWPTSTLLVLISFGDTMSHTAIERSCGTDVRYTCERYSIYIKTYFKMD